MSEGTVYIVDDDDAVRESLAELLQACGYDASAYGSGREFLNGCGGAAKGCLLADVRMPDMDGLELQGVVARDHPGLAVVIMTGHGDVPLAVRAMKAGAIDFIEKPFDQRLLLEAIKNALAAGESKRGKDAESKAAREQIAQLTPRERDVLEQLLAGRANKVAAFELGISPRTIEIHRAHIMSKLSARNLSSVVRIAIAAGVGVN